MIQEDVDALAALKRLPDIFEVYHRSSFRCYRNTNTGAVQEVIVEILDAGPGTSPRFHVGAKVKGGKVASGDAADTIDAAVAMLHLSDLD
jgi:hypothetical protein